MTVLPMMPYKQYWSAGGKKTTDEKTLLSGIVAYRGYNTEKIIGTEFPAGMNEAALKDLYANGKKGRYCTGL